MGKPTKKVVVIQFEDDGSGESPELWKADDGERFFRYLVDNELTGRVTILKLNKREWRHAQDLGASFAGEISPKRERLLHRRLRDRARRSK